MKIALITDTHFGVRNDNQTFHQANKKFFGEVFFPYLYKNNIQHLIHLGDLVDRRRYINFVSASEMRKTFLDPLQQMIDLGEMKEVHIIAGNHDVYYKNTNLINALDEIVGNKYDFTIHTNPTQLAIGDTPFLLLPWINPENYDATISAINNSNAEICMGHLELNGFEMYRGTVSTHGEDPSIFNRFDVVCSGHYHHRSSTGNIHYLGSHGQFVWSDYGDQRGFHIFDTETRELTFIANPDNMFYKHHYDDSDTNIDDLLKFDESQYTGKYVKVIVRNKDNPIWFDMMIDKIERAQPADVQTVEDHLNLNLDDDSDIVNETEDTLTSLKKHVHSMSMKTDLFRVEKIITELYTEAQSIT